MFAGLQDFLPHSLSQPVATSNLDGCVSSATCSSRLIVTGDKDRSVSKLALRLVEKVRTEGCCEELKARLAANRIGKCSLQPSTEAPCEQAKGDSCRERNLGESPREGFF